MSCTFGVTVLRSGISKDVEECRHPSHGHHPEGGKVESGTELMKPWLCLQHNCLSEPSQRKTETGPTNGSQSPHLLNMHSSKNMHSLKNENVHKHHVLPPSV